MQTARCDYREETMSRQGGKARGPGEANLEKS